MQGLVKIESGEITVAEEVINKIIEFKKLQKEMDYQEKLLKEELMSAMEEVGMTNFSINGLSASIRKGSERTTLDSKRLKAECPEIWDCYSITSETKPSLVLTFND